MARGEQKLTSEDMRIELAAEEKFLMERVMRVEKNFAALALDVGWLIRKIAKMRNRGDSLARTIKMHGDEEDGSYRKSVLAIAECFGALEDYRQALVDRLEAKVHSPLMNYESVCRKAKEEIKDSNNSREKELSKQRQLDRTRVKDPSNLKKISQLESDVKKAKVDCLRMSNSLEEYMGNFEKRKIQDYKTIMGEFIHAQMLYHAKALEMYTLAYQHTQAVDESEQLDLFISGLPRLKGNGQVSLQRTNSDSVLHGSTQRSASPGHMQT